MNIKLRALSYTAGIFAAGAVAGLALIQILEMLPQAWLPNIAIGVLIAVAFNLVYGFTKAQLEFKEKMAEIAKK